MKTHPISFLSGFIAATAVPVLVNAASLSRSLLLDPTPIVQGKGLIVLAEKTAKGKTKLNVDANGVILKGYDPVAYFTRHQAIKGDPSIRTSYGGAVYHFSSVADKAAFDKNPSRYVPQYGGFCANTMSKGGMKDSDPNVFSVYKGKLFVCSAPEALKEFSSNIEENIRKADDNWNLVHFGWHGHPAL